MRSRLIQIVRQATRVSVGGAALLEFALVLPLLLLLCLGMIQYGLVLLAQNQLQYAAREGVRQAALFGDPSVGTAAAMQNMVATSWVQPRAILRGCDSYGQPCEAGLCATYDLVTPLFFLPKSITIQAYAEALTERQTTASDCADSLSSFTNSGNCTVTHVNPC